ncbi:hypothetical protein HDU93_006925 [Gonapodya sp. JEL0774]|nr:hypothetical protein HDU93_006925 [Gonapodya sp. JEL0774]
MIDRGTRKDSTLSTFLVPVWFPNVTSLGTVLLHKSMWRNLLEALNGIPIEQALRSISHIRTEGGVKVIAARSAIIMERDVLRTIAEGFVRYMPGLSSMDIKWEYSPDTYYPGDIKVIIAVWTLFVQMVPACKFTFIHVLHDWHTERSHPGHIVFVEGLEKACQACGKDFETRVGFLGEDGTEIEMDYNESVEHSESEEHTDSVEDSETDSEHRPTTKQKVAEAVTKFKLQMAAEDEEED